MSNPKKSNTDQVGTTNDDQVMHTAGYGDEKNLNTMPENKLSKGFKTKGKSGVKEYRKGRFSKDDHDE